MANEDRFERELDDVIGTFIDDVGAKQMEEILQIRAQDMRELQSSGRHSNNGSVKVDRLEVDAENLDVADDSDDDDPMVA